MTKKLEFSYLVKIKIGARNISMLIRNHKEVPEKILSIMAKEKIEKEITQSYIQLKHYRNQTSDHYFNKMMKESSYEIEDLNNVEVYDLQLNFDSQEKIVNKSEDEKEIIKSKLKIVNNGRQKRKIKEIRTNEFTS